MAKKKLSSAKLDRAIAALEEVEACGDREEYMSPIASAALRCRIEDALEGLRKAAERMDRQAPRLTRMRP